MKHPVPAAAAIYRNATQTDRASMRALAEQELAGTPYAAIVEYFLRLALEERSDESRAIVAEQRSEIVGFALFGDVAGSIGTGRMHFIGVSASARLNTIGIGLCEAAVADLASKGARLIVAEVPDDNLLAAGRALLARCGFVEVARVGNYYRDGADLVVLRRSVAPAS